MARLDVLVVGAGQAGLAAGYHLKRLGLEFLIVEAAARVGDNWRRRYDSLTLFTPRAFSNLPGLNLAGDPDDYPSKDEFADYLERYADKFDLPVQTGTQITKVEMDGADFRAVLSDGSEFRASALIVATGGFQRPARPALSRGFSDNVIQLDAEAYSNASDLPGGPVLVVGDGASGRDVAVELAASRETMLAIGKPRKLFPERVLGRSVWWWLKTLGLMSVKADSFLGRMMRKADPFPDRGRSIRALEAAKVKIVPRLVKAEGQIATFANGGCASIASVVWAVGYEDDFDWLDIATAKDRDGRVNHREGVSPVRGLFFVGRPWQRNRASALVMGAGNDAAAIVSLIAASAGKKSR